MSDPRVDRPHVPGYGIPTSTEGVLAWSWAVERLERADVYWLATASASGTPHLIPIWGAWVDGHWYVEGGPTRWQRNLRENPQMAIHVEGAGSGVAGAEVIIVEGRGVELTAPEIAAGGPDPGGIREVQAGVRSVGGPLDARWPVGAASVEGIRVDDVPRRYDPLHVRRGVVAAPAPVHPSPAVT